MAALLSSTGNKNISAADINAAIKGKTPEQVYQLAQQHGVSAQQIADATGGAGGLDVASINNWVSNYNPAPTPTPTPTATATPTPTPTPTATANNQAAQNRDFSSLYGMGNPDVTDDQIRQFINRENVSEEQIFNEALARGVNIDQLTRAMAGDPNFTPDKVNSYLTSIGVSAPANNSDLSTFFGEGNAQITDQMIRDFINREGVSEEQIFDEALRNGISVEQIRRAMGGHPDFTSDKIIEYLKSRNVVNPNQELIDQEARRVKYDLPDKVNIDPNQYNATAAEAAKATRDPIEGTVAGQLSKILNPNSQLMTQAGTFGAQQANSRGLLNSSLGASAAQAEMIRAGLPIASADAASANQFSLANAQNQQQANLFNADNLRQYDLQKLNISRDMAINAEEIAKSYGLAELDVQNKVDLANINAASKSSTDAASLNDTLIRAILDVNKQDISQASKDAQIKTLIETTDGSIAMLGAFDRIAGVANPERTGQDAGQGTGGQQDAGSGSLAEGEVTNTAGYELTQSEKNRAQTAKDRGIEFDERKVITAKEISDAPGGLNDFPNARNLFAGEAIPALYVRP